jgi:diguanylate cyclase (GGDEF)-like protein/PAS domain S-box-containing protein
MDSAHATPSVAGSVGNPLELAEVVEETAIMLDAYESSLRANEMDRLPPESAPDGIYATDANGRTTFINPAAMEMTGWTAEDVLGKPEQKFVNHFLPGATQLSPVPGGDNSVFWRKDGTSFPAACTGTSVVHHGKLLGTVTAFRDISASRRQERWERSKNVIFSAIIAQHPLSSTLQLLADAFVALYPPKSIAIFVLAGDQFHIEAEAGLPPRPVPPMAPALLAQEALGNVGLTEASGSRDFAADSCPVFLEILKTGIKLCLAWPLTSGSGEAKGLVTVFDAQPALLDDATRQTIRSLCDLGRMAIEHRQLCDQVLQASHYDHLTGLPNRIFLEDRLRQAMVSARRQGKLIAVCCIDLDHFKQINDNLGHELGDACFKVVSERLKAMVREVDILVRHGDDEFILALTDLAGTSDAIAICHRLIKDLSAPMLLDGHALTLTATVGISIFPDHGENSDLLLRNADMALVGAKGTGRGHVQVYSPGLGRHNRRAAEMENALGMAVSQRQFRLAYQPIYTIQREIAGFEALLRWEHPTLGPVAPQEFIPIAERTGLIVPIGDWVIEEVCRQAMDWNVPAVPWVKIFANISGAQLAGPNFGSKIAQTLERSGLPPERLELEITESWVISDLRAAAAKLQKLRDLGIGIAMDDFGTGHSSFNYLQALPLDTLKIDRSFIHRLDGSAANLATVRAITGLAHQLGLKTVAEGVESEQHLTLLGRLGCELMQGFFLGRPLTPEAASSLLLNSFKQSLAGATAKHPLAEYVSR